MAEIVNLRLVRKARTRAERQAEAERNRLLHGRPKAERRLSASEREAAERRLDGHRRRRDDDGAG